MKILHVDPEVAFGGGERQVLGLLRHLARRGYENVLVTPPDARLAALAPAADARQVALRVRNDADLLAALRLRRIVAAQRPDLVHFHTARALAMSPWLGRQARHAVVTRRMDYPLRPGPWTSLLYNRSVAAVVAISEDVRRRLLDAGVRAERITVVHSAVEPPAGPLASGRAAARARFGLGEDAVIGVVAALEYRKGHDVLFRALARLHAAFPAMRCLVCGDGSRRAELERLAAELGIHEVARFLGEQRQVADVLAAVDVFVMPSRHEGLGVAVLEAMAAGLPVVASAVGGIPETVESERTGVLVAPQDPAALAAAIASLLREPDRARRLGAAGRARVLAEFSMERMADRYERVYAHVASRPRAAHAASPVA